MLTSLRSKLTAKQVAKLLIGAGKKVEHWTDNEWTWSQHGGHPDAFFRKLHLALKKLKFTDVDSSSQNSPDGNVVNSGTIYSGKHGVVTIKKSYGVVAYDNYFQVKFNARDTCL